MKLIRFGPPGREKPGVQLPDGTRVDASGFVRDYDEDFFGGEGPGALASWAAGEAKQAPRVPAGSRLGPPVRRPGHLICIGLNYRDHARESNMPIPAEPVIFSKAPSALAGPDDDLVMPRGTVKLDWEVELAFVIGKAARYVPKERALDHVAGYVLHNDVSERVAQLERGGQWIKGKSHDGFAPLGPWLATPDEIPDPGKLDLWLKVNGETLQKGTTAELIFDIPTLVSALSEFMTLRPGDVVSTGTPPGVGLGLKPPRFLKVGDVVEWGVTGLGTAKHRVVASA